MTIKWTKQNIIETVGRALEEIQSMNTGMVKGAPGTMGTQVNATEIIRQSLGNKLQSSQQTPQQGTVASKGKTGRMSQPKGNAPQQG